MFRRFLEPRVEKRPSGLGDLSKFLEDRWLTKTAGDKASECKKTKTGIRFMVRNVILMSLFFADYDDDELCPSMYSFHSNLEEKNRLLHTLSEYGIETVVDRAAKKERIRDWIQSSVITEEEVEVRVTCR